MQMSYEWHICTTYSNPSTFIVIDNRVHPCTNKMSIMSLMDSQINKPCLKDKQREK